MAMLNNQRVYPLLTISITHYWDLLTSISLLTIIITITISLYTGWSIGFIAHSIHWLVYDPVS